MNIWQIRPLLKEKHKDWHPTSYTLINHVLGLNSDRFVRIVPPENVQSLQTWLREYQQLRKVLRARYSRARVTLVRLISSNKSLPLKKTQSIVDRLSKYYPRKISITFFLRQDLKLREESKRWRAFEKLITKLSPEIVDISESASGRMISLNKQVIKSDLSKYSPEQIEEAISNKKKLISSSRTLMKQSKCYAID